MLSGLPKIFSLFAGVVMASQILFGCAMIDLVSPADCSVIKINQILQEPYKYSERVICTKGYFQNSGQPILLPTINLKKSRYDNPVIILDYKNYIVEKMVNDLSFGDLVLVRGRVHVPDECWRTSRKGEEYICTPYMKPIDIEVYQIKAEVIVP